MDQDAKRITFWARVRRATTRDHALNRARRHDHPDLRDVEARIDGFLREPPSIQALAIGSIVERIERAQPGLRGGGFSFASSAFASGGALIVTFGVAVLSGFLAALASYPDDAGHFRESDVDAFGVVVSTVTTTIICVVAVLLLVGLGTYIWQRDTDMRRAVRVAWLRLYEDALANRGATKRSVKVGRLTLRLRFRPSPRNGAAG